MRVAELFASRWQAATLVLIVVIPPRTHSYLATHVQPISLYKCQVTSILFRAVLIGPRNAVNRLFIHVLRELKANRDARAKDAAMVELVRRVLDNDPREVRESKRSAKRSASSPKHSPSSWPRC